MTRLLAPPADGAGVRLAARAGRVAGQTSGLAHGFLQGNLVILESAVAAEFRAFCEANPKPCPLIGVGSQGNPFLPSLGADLDIRTDLPRYRVWQHGELVGEPADIGHLWRDDLVAFIIGCSFSFEEALIADGLEVRHIALGRNVPMYRTNRACTPVGRFAGPLVVSMRPFSPADAIRAIEITARYPAVHGSPVHIGRPDLLGIADLARPDYGDPVPVGADELPVFWACGVTPQAIIAAAKPAFAITHAPGCMLVTDRLNEEFRTPLPSAAA